MAIDSTHPLYDAKAPDWRVMRDTYEGQRAIRWADFLYLAATGGQVADGALNKAPSSVGWKSYEAYRNRAQFPELVQEAIQTLVGVMHQEPAIITLPEAMKPLIEKATRRGESLQALLRRVNEQQLLRGRAGLLTDFDPTGASNLPHLVQYDAEMITNWDDERLEEMSMDTLSLVVLNETSVVRGRGTDIFSWETEPRYRALVLDEFGNYLTFTEVDGLRGEEINPLFRGNSFDEIPFTFIGANDLSPDPDDIPLLPVAQGSISLYQQSADYRQTLHMQGQDTLVVIGDELGKTGMAKDENEDTRVGSGSVLRVEREGDAKFIGVSGEALGEQRASYDAELALVLSKGPRMLEGRKGQAESGDALRTRVAASTSSLKTVALTGAGGVEAQLKKTARWMGEDPDKVSVKPNLDFAQDQPEPRLAGDYWTAIADGAPLSEQSFHEWAQRKNFTKRTFEDEIKLVKKEREERAARAPVQVQVPATLPLPGGDNEPPGSPEE